MILPKIVFEYDFGQIQQIYCLRGNRSLNLPFQSPQKMRATQFLSTTVYLRNYLYKKQIFHFFLLRFMALKCLRKTNVVEIFHEIDHNFLNKVWLKSV